ncbi:MAG: hypothetical protein ABL961_04965 [Vicinamibacterales bacterium]
MIPGKQYTPELIAAMAWRRKWWILIPTVVISLGVAGWTRTLTDLYRSDTVILVVPQQVPEAYVKSTVTASVADRLQSISQQILSRTRLERIILDLNLFERERKTGIMEDIIDAMRGQISVLTVRGDSFRVSFTSEDPRTAMRVTERLGSLFIDESLRDREVLAEGTSQFLEAQLEDARRQLIDNEKRLEEYRRTHNGQLPNQLTANMQGLHNIETQLQTLQESMARDRDRRDALRQVVVDLENNVFTQPSSQSSLVPSQATAADRLKEAEAALVGLQRRVRPTHPDYIRAVKSVEELRRVAEAEQAQSPVSDEVTALPPIERLRRNRLNDVNRELVALDKGLAAKVADEAKLRESLTQYQRRIEATPTSESELIELMRDYGTLQSMYQTLLGKKQDSQISANLERRQIGEQFRVLDPARMPVRPFTPNRPRLYGLGFVGGLGLGLALAALLEYLDKKLRSEDDIRAVLNLPVLAAVPFMEEGSVTNRRRVLAVSVLATVTVVAAAAFGAWRYLR